MTLIPEFKPVYDEKSGAHLIDGCYCNVCPADVGKKRARYVIAVSVAPPVNFTVSTRKARLF
jgi:hypothetical protein